MERFFNDVKRSCQTIYNTITQMRDDEYKYVKRGFGGDLSSQIDLVAEKVFIQNLSSYGKIYSEESGIIGEGKRKIVVDPIDGSDNLLSSFPYYGSSIALQENGKTLFSFIVNYANGDFFVKYNDFYKKGSLLYNELRDIKTNKFAKVGVFEKAYANPDIVAKLKSVGLKFRSPGAVALSLAYARYLKFVLFIGKIRPFDVAAGLHQCEDLYLFKNQSVIIITRDKDIFRQLKTIVVKD